MARRSDSHPTAGTALRTRLTAAPGADDRTRRWPADVAAVIESAVTRESARSWSPIRVHGGPGTGKSSVIVDAAVARLLRDDVDAGPVGQHHLVDDLADGLRVRQRRAVVAHRHVAEGVHAEDDVAHPLPQYG